MITCPLEVVKTRLQSSQSAQFVCSNGHHTPATFSTAVSAPSTTSPRTATSIFRHLRSISSWLVEHSKTWQCLEDTARKEGVRGLWRGLGPNLIGVMPSRSIYFFTYSFAKKTLSPTEGKSGPLVHILSAMCAGAATSTATNPIWLVKTRLQLTRASRSPTTRPFLGLVDCVMGIFRKDGLLGFYRGLSASYFGERSRLFLKEGGKKREGQRERDRERERE